MDNKGINFQATSPPAYVNPAPGFPDPVMITTQNAPVGGTAYVIPATPNATGHTIVIPETQRGMLVPMGPKNVQTICPQCNNNMVTKIKKSPSTTAYISGFCIAIVGCFCGCCLIPCFMDSCKTVEHTCSNCGQFLGKYSKYY